MVCLTSFSDRKKLGPTYKVHRKKIFSFQNPEQGSFCHGTSKNQAHALTKNAKFLSVCILPCTIMLLKYNWETIPDVKMETGMTVAIPIIYPKQVFNDVL